MKVVYLSLCYFDATSIIGGGERYAYELAKVMSLQWRVMGQERGGGICDPCGLNR